MYAVALILIGIFRPIIYKQIVDTMSLGVSEETFDQIIHYLWILFWLIVIVQIFFRVADYTVTYFQSKVLKTMTDDAYWRLHQHSSDFFESNFVGSLVTKARRFVRSFESVNDALIWNVWFPLVTCAGVLISLLFVSKMLSLIFFIWTIFYIFVTWVFIKYKRPLDLAKARQDSKVTGLLADTLSNFLNVKIFASLKDEHHMFKHATRQEHQIRLRAWQFGNHQNGVQAILLGFVLEFGMMYFVIKMWQNGTATLGTVVLVQAYLASVFGQLWTLGKGLTKMAEAFSDAQEMIDIFESEVGVKDPPEPDHVLISRGEISFKRMGFRYSDASAVFDDFNLTIPAGQKVGLVGHSGAGKTTIVKLLLRFVDVSSGDLLIDGQSTARITQDDLRRNISYVPQEPILFHRSLRENILYGDPLASEEELISAAKKAHAHDFISQLPEGYDTLVGERGVKLSGGERQRVAIARAMLKNAPILILDEATSALDSISERHIQDAFDELMKGRTTIVIAHRLSTIQKLDRIIVLEDGSIAEEGTHKELVQKNGVYSSFWEQQVGGFISE